MSVCLSCLKVGSRVVVVVSGVVMVGMGMMGKVSAIFTTIPAPVMGGMFMVMFGVITAAGVSNLQVCTRHVLILTQFLCQNNSNTTSLYFQYANMNSSRNIFVFGFSMFSALVIPNWIIKHPEAISTGAQIQLSHTIIT